MGVTRETANTTVDMRRLLVVAGVLVLIIGVPLYLVPQNSGDYFSWSVQPELSAAFLGGAYLSAAVIEFAAARERSWADARVAIPAVLMFTLLTLIVTLANRNQYNFTASGFVQSAGTWAWLVVYAVVPPIMAIVLMVQLRREGADPERARPTSGVLRVVMAAGGAMLLVGGVILLVDPGAASWMWPWRLSSLTARAFGAWMVGFGVAMVQISWEADWRRIRPATAGAGTLGILQLVAVLRYRSVLDWGAVQTWIYIAVLGAYVVLGLYGWRAAAPRVTPTSARL